MGSIGALRKSISMKQNSKPSTLKVELVGGKYDGYWAQLSIPLPRVIKKTALVVSPSKSRTYVYIFIDSDIRYHLDRIEING